jgi:carboxymethylenebutenolidase
MEDEMDLMDIATGDVTLNVSDGTSMRAYVAHPSGPFTPQGLLVFQEAFGVNAHIRDITERFARQGYLAIAPELFHRTAPGFEGDYTNMSSAMPHMGALTADGMQADARAAYDWLRANSSAPDAPIAAIGFCLGGRASFLSALALPLKCAISFYGGGIAPGPRGPGVLDRAPQLQAPMLFFWGGRDKHVGPEQSGAVDAALRAARKDFVHVEFSYADHGFFCDARASYNPTAAAEAWPLVLAFLSTHMAAAKQSEAARS